MEVQNKLGIKESMEVLAAVELFSVSGIDIFKDGLGAEDIEKAYALVKKSEVLVEGAKGIDLVDDEMKDLDQAELIQLGTVAFAMVKNIIAASKKQVA